MMQSSTHSWRCRLRTWWKACDLGVQDRSADPIPWYHLHNAVVVRCVKVRCKIGSQTVSVSARLRLRLLRLCSLAHPPRCGHRLPSASTSVRHMLHYTQNNLNDGAQLGAGGAGLSHPATANPSCGPWTVSPPDGQRAGVTTLPVVPPLASPHRALAAAAGSGIETATATASACPWPAGRRERRHCPTPRPAGSCCGRAAAWVPPAAWH